MSTNKSDSPKELEKRYRGLLKGFAEEQRLGPDYWLSTAERQLKHQRERWQQKAGRAGR